jgi:hypothetical protein
MTATQKQWTNPQTTSTVIPMSSPNTEADLQLAAARQAGLSAARLTALGAFFAVIFAAAGSYIQIESQLDAARDDARTAYEREIGTVALTTYLSALIDAEAEQGRVILAISEGTTSDERTELSAALDSVSAKLKAAKGPVDLIATQDVGNLAALSIDLYGANSGLLKRDPKVRTETNTRTIAR